MANNAGNPYESINFHEFTRDSRIRILMNRIESEDSLFAQISHAIQFLSRGRYQNPPKPALLPLYSLRERMQHHREAEVQEMRCLQAANWREYINKKGGILSNEPVINFADLTRATIQEATERVRREEEAARSMLPPPLPQRRPTHSYHPTAPQLSGQNSNQDHTFDRAYVDESTGSSQYYRN